MKYIVAGARQGSGIHVPGRGVLTQGKLDDDAARRLRALGVDVVEHVWQEPRVSDTEWAERAAADRMLGRLPNAEGMTRTDLDIAKSMAKLLQPMNKYSLIKKNSGWRKNW